MSLQNAWKLLQIGGDVGGQVGADTASWNLLVESLYERALDVGFGHVGRLREWVSTPNHFVFVAVLLLVSPSSPNLLDVELVVGQIVIDVAVDGARECVAGVGVMLSDGSDSLHGESAVTFAEFHPRRFVDAEMYLVVVYLCHSKWSVGLDVQLLVS